MGGVKWREEKREGVRSKGREVKKEEKGEGRRTEIERKGTEKEEGRKEIKGIHSRKRWIGVRQAVRERERSGQEKREGVAGHEE